MQHEIENETETGVETTLRKFIETDLNSELQDLRLSFRQPLREWFSGTRDSVQRLKKVAKVKEIAYKAVYSSSFTYLNKPVVVIVLNEIYNMRFVMKLRVKAYVVDIRYEFMFKSDMTEIILQECNEQGLIPEGSTFSKQQTAGKKISA